jgi:diguanylate cyclase (GGDEF)-like protein
LPVTASFGVSTCLPGEPLTAVDLLERADAALYQAKNAGRNKVSVAR